MKLKPAIAWIYRWCVRRRLDPSRLLFRIYVIGHYITRDFRLKLCFWMNCTHFDKYKPALWRRINIFGLYCSVFVFTFVFIKISKAVKIKNLKLKYSLINPTKPLCKHIVIWRSSLPFSSDNYSCLITGGPISERSIYFEYLTVIIF
jgi:glucan phosphoethanolaminetransferase (alkaline phosphatase superfamily)